MILVMILVNDLGVILISGNFLTSGAVARITGSRPTAPVDKEQLWVEQAAVSMSWAVPEPFVSRTCLTGFRLLCHDEFFDSDMSLFCQAKCSNI
jgi:hypothetical protein